MLKHTLKSIRDRFLDPGTRRQYSSVDWHKSKLQTLWHGWVQPIAGLVVLIRFSVLVAILSAYILFVNDQGQELLRGLAESRDASQISCFVVAAILCAVVSWYWARVAFFYSYNGSSNTNPAHHPLIREHLPRLIGATVFITIAAALVKASFVYEDASGPSTWMRLLAVVFLILGALFPRFARRHLRVWCRLRDSDRPADPNFIEHLPKKTRVFLGLGLFITVSLTVAFAYEATVIGPFLGAGTIFLLFAAALIPNGTFLVLYFGTRKRLPVIGFLIAWAVAASFVVDNHRVRQDPEMRSYHEFKSDPGSPRAFQRIQSIEDYYFTWIQKLEQQHRGDVAVPVVIVAAEGGGIRAAYWTATVLGELQDRSLEHHGIDFARHVFAISGVSGGSLGAATFTTLLAADEAGDGARNDGNCHDLYSGNPYSLRHRADRILSKDFLSPTVAVMLFPDFFQRFFPVSILDDRAMALERAWEAAWRACEEGDRFSEPFENLWQGAYLEEWPTYSTFDVPLLFLNSTVVDSGQRMIASPIDFDAKAFDDSFSDALETTRVLGHDVPLSTAVHTSARFTYVSPAGTVRRLDLNPDAPDRERWMRVVDGGYFENSGAVTAEEILAGVERAAWLRWRRAPEGKKPIPIRPIIVHISNDPIRPFNVEWTRYSSRGVLVAEALSPLEALLNVRPARGHQATKSLAYRVTSTNGQAARANRAALAVAQPGMHLHFRLCEYGVPLPLGWMLSKDTREEMQAQLSDSLGERRDRTRRPVAAYHDNMVRRLLSALDTGHDLDATEHLRVVTHAHCAQPARGLDSGRIASR